MSTVPAVPGWTSYSIEDGLASNDVVAIDVNADGSVWALTATAVNQFDGTSWSSHPFHFDTYPGSQVIAGPGGTAWVQGPEGWGTPGILLEYEGREVRSVFDPADGWDGPALVSPGDAGTDGALWGMGIPGRFSFDETALLRFDSTRWDEVQPPDHSTWDELVVHGLWVAPDDRPRLLTDGGVLRLDVDGSWSVFEREPFGDVLFSTMAPNGTIHRVGIGISKEPGRNDQYTTTHETFDGTTWTPLEADSSWLGLIQRPGPDDPMPVMAAIGTNHLFVSGVGGLLWSNLHTGEVRLLTTDNGLASDTTRQVATGPDGSVWVATDAGVSRFVPEPESVDATG